MSGTIDQSYLRRCSIHHTYNRACTIHGVHRLRVQDNVAFDNMGHAFFLEDSVRADASLGLTTRSAYLSTRHSLRAHCSILTPARHSSRPRLLATLQVETKNVITGNLGVLTKPSFAMLNTDQTPATFWITNADNNVSGNVAAGSQNYGFWFDVPPRPRGASTNCALGDTICPTASAMCPQGATILAFRDNVAHSNHKYGLRIHHAEGGFWPRKDPCSAPGNNNRWDQAKVERFLGWRNGINGVTVGRVAALALVDSQFVDNLARGVEMPGVAMGKGDKKHFRGPWGANVITRSLFVGYSRETAEGATMPPFATSSAPFTTPRITDGIIQHCPPGTGARASASGFGCESLRIGLETQAWHRLTVRNVTFANYRQKSVATAGMARVELYGGGGGWETRFAGVTWQNAQRRVRWRWNDEGVFTDMDGTFTEVGVGYFAATSELLADRRAFPECRYDVRYSGMLCSSALRMVRFEVGGVPSGESAYLFQVRYGDNRKAPECYTGREVRVGSFVQSSECRYLSDKWYPEGEFFHVEMDATAPVLTPRVVGGRSGWWRAGTEGAWDFSDPLHVAAQFAFQTECLVPDVGMVNCIRNLTATFSVDGTQLLWNESWPELRTHVPWYRCELVPAKCVGKVRYPSLPSSGKKTITRRLIHGRKFTHWILAVNKTYEVDYNYWAYMTSYSYSLGELRDGEWISFRTSQWGNNEAQSPVFHEPSPTPIAAVGHGFTTSLLGTTASLADQSQPGLHTPRAPISGHTFDPVTRTSTFTIANAPACAWYANEPCIHHLGGYGLTYHAPFPPPPPPEPPMSPPGFFTPSPAPPAPQAPPDIRFWSDPASWGGTLPKRGDSVTIPAGVLIVLDMSPPLLVKLEIKGTLIAWNRRSTDVVLHAMYLHITTEGRLMAGSPGDPFLGRFAIHLSGEDTLPPKSFCGLGSKSLCVDGLLSLVGPTPNRAWTRLNQTADANSSTLTTEEQVDWKDGDAIVVASSTYDEAHAETLSVSSVTNFGWLGSGAPTQLLTQTPLAFRHFAGTETHAGRQVKMASEVAVLNRSIEIIGVDLFATDFNFKPGGKAFGWRARIKGEAWLIGVRMVGGGLFRSPKIYTPTLHLQGTKGSVVRSCTFEKMIAQPIRINGERSVVDANVILNSVMSAIMIMNGDRVHVTNNLVLSTHCMSFCAGCCGKWNVNVGNFDIVGKADTLTFTGNTAAGGVHGIRIVTEPPAIFADNVVHSQQFAVTLNLDGQWAGCKPIVLKNLVLWRNWDFGICA
jgi:hypothetical protein